eukprot:7886705-Lingulodinium_polyedra.AAC.1
MEKPSLANGPARGPRVQTTAWERPRQELKRLRTEPARTRNGRGPEWPRNETASERLRNGYATATR